MPALLVVLVAAAVLLAAGPGGARRGAVRRLRASGRGVARSGLPAGSGAPVGSGLRVGSPAGSRTPWRPGRRAPDATTALAAAVAGAAAELRAGRSPGEAWHAVLGVPVPADGVPHPADVRAALGAPDAGGPLALLRGRRAGDPGATDRRVAGVLAATRLAAGLGAPLADVLDGCARSLAADAEAETDLRAALAGPTQTTTLLTWLPVVAVLAGTLLGADAVAVLLDGRTGTAAGLLGVVLTVAGRRWVARLVATARAAGDRAAGG